MVEDLRGREIVAATPSELVGKESVLKSDVVAVLFWFGQRFYDNDDLDRFHHEFFMWSGFPLAASFELPEADEVKGEPYPALARVDVDLRNFLSKIPRHVAIFMIGTSHLAEKEWVRNIPDGLRNVRLHEGKPEPHIYQIYMGGFGFSDRDDGLDKYSYSYYLNRAVELGGVYLKYDTDQPTIHTKRLVDYMNRLVGADLPGPEFPDYSLDDQRRIAMHITREDFNSFRPRRGALPKYPIVEGKPQFPTNF